jgi:peptide subunit release factor 1 (eRF1)
VVDAAGAGGLAAFGREETLRALDEMRVDTLLLSRSFILQQPDLADRCVGAALAQDAAVEELSEEGAARLDRGGGIGARLRYRVRGPRQEAAAGQGESGDDAL